jgi:hypothetical protein
MKRSLVLLLGLALALPAFGAEITEVPDAADGEDVFDANIEVRFESEWHHALIQRENTQVSINGEENTPRTLNVKEFEYDRYRFKLIPRIQVGIFQDLAGFFELPVVLSDQKNFAYADGTSAANSTVHQDLQRGASPVIIGWPQTEGNDTFPPSIDGTAFGRPARQYNAWGWNTAGNGGFTSQRSGFDHPRLGLRWSPVNNERDPSKPTITIGASYNLGILPFPVQNPSQDPANVDNPGPVARAAHEFHVQVATSKRFGLLDPYFVIEYWGPFATSYAERGYKPRQRGGFTMGMEIVPYEDKEKQQKFALDFSYRAYYHSEGRDYSELSDPLFEITQTEQYLRTGAGLGLHFTLFEYVSFHAGLNMLYDTEHIVTGEAIGTDLDDPGDDGFGLVDLDDERERSEFFNPYYDTPGRRFSVADSFRLQGNLHLKLTF